MPGYRQMPKLKGFTNFSAIKYAEINVSELEKIEKTEIDLAVLKELGKAHPSTAELRVLGNGELSKAVTVSARYFTGSAKEKIEKAGGKAQLV
jgi:large subunit ribosomal protein L15